MSENPEIHRDNIPIGAEVGVTMKADRNTIIRGPVKAYLTRNEFHPHGIMVESNDGTTGRVKEIYSDLSDKIRTDSLIAHGRNELLNPLAVDRDPKQTVISIKDGDTVYSYKNLFFSYLQGAKRIRIEDPYIRKEYQIKNLVQFLTILLEEAIPRDIHLITAADDSLSQFVQERKLRELRDDLSCSNIVFSFEFDQTVHDRVIYADTEWKIILGRGIDLFNDPCTYYAVSNFEQTKRECKQTEIHYMRVDKQGDAR